MNVKIANKYAALLAGLDIDFIKSIEGEFTPEDIIMQFSNFFFNKMIIDITAIKGYQDITKIQELSVNMDMSKVILLLDDSKSPISLLEMGLYAKSKKLIVFCTPKFYRFDNVRLTCEKYHIPLVQDLHPLIIANKIISKM